MKEDIRLHEGELNVMELLWSNKILAAKDIAKIIKEYIGWEKNTTYTVINRLITKGAIVREEPGFFCRAVISRKVVQKMEVESMLKKVFNGSLETFLSEYLSNQNLKPSEIKELEHILLEQKKKSNSI